MTEEREEWDVEMALRGELKELALVLLDVLNFQDCPVGLIEDKLEALAKWLPTVQSRNLVGAFWKEVLRVAETSFWEVIKANLEGGHIILAKARAVRLVEFLDHYEVLFGLKPPEEEKVAEAVVEEPVGTPLAVLGLSTKVYNTLMRPVNTKAAFGVGRAPFVEEIVAVLQDDSKGEEFLLWNVRFFGPVALAELKENLQEHGFLPAETPEAPPELPTEYHW